jgi:hypothetical protein
MRKDTLMIDENLRARDPLDTGVVKEIHAASEPLLRSILSHERRPRRNARRPLRSSRLAPAVAAIAVVLLLSAVVTTPGQAVTSWVGQRLGVGQAGTEQPVRISRPGDAPSMQPSREFSHQGSPAEGQPAVVAASGATPGGRHYELVAYQPKEDGASDESEPLCFELDFPEARSIGTFTCELPKTGTSLGYVDAMESELPGSSFSYAAGLTGADVAAVDVALGGAPARARLVPIPTKVLSRLGVARPLNFYIAFFPADSVGSVEVTGRDAGGAPLARGSARLP